MSDVRVSMDQASDAKVLMISVAARMAGMHPQTLRQYDRLGLVQPGRAAGGGRRYSVRDVALLREIQRLSQEDGVNLAGIKRIIELEQLAGRAAAADGRAGGRSWTRRTSGWPSWRRPARFPGGDLVPTRSTSTALVVWRPASRPAALSSHRPGDAAEWPWAGTSDSAEASAEAAGVADQAALAPVVVVEQVRAGQQHPGVVRPGPISSSPSSSACSTSLRSRRLRVGAEVGPDRRRRRRCTGSAGRTGGPGRPGPWPARRGCRSGGRRRPAGPSPAASSPAAPSPGGTPTPAAPPGDGSTGFAKPRNVGLLHAHAAAFRSLATRGVTRAPAGTRYCSVATR